MALATVADLKEMLSIQHADDDVLLTRYVDAASDYLEHQTGRVFAATDYVEIQDGQGGRSIIPSNYPVISVASVYINGEAQTLSTGYGVTGYYLSGDVVKFRDSFVSEGSGNVTVSYRAGYGTIPDDLVQSTLEMSALMYRERDRVGQQSRSGQDGSVTFYYAPPARVVATIEAYRRAL